MITLRASHAAIYAAIMFFAVWTLASCPGINPILPPIVPPVQAASGSITEKDLRLELLDNRKFTIYFHRATDSTDQQLNECELIAGDDVFMWLRGKVPGSSTTTEFLVSHAAITHITGITPPLT